MSTKLFLSYLKIVLSELIFMKIDIMVNYIEYSIINDIIKQTFLSR